MPLTASKRRANKTIAALVGFSALPALGIACFRLTAWFMFSSDPSVVDANLSFVSRFTQAAVLVLMVVLDRFVDYRESTLMRATGAAAVAMSAGAVLFLLAPTEPLGYAGCALNGAASAVLMMSWGYYLCSVEPQKSAFNITLAFAVFGIATWVLSYVPQPWTTVLTMALPLASFGCLFTSLSRDVRKTEGEAKLTKKALAGIPWGMVALLLICTTVSILAKLLAPTSDTLTSASYRFFWPAIFILIFVLFFVWMFVLKRNDQDVLWPVFVLIIFSGLLCYSSLSATQPAFAAAFLRATQECLMLFCWLAVTGIVFTRRLPRLFFFGMSMLVIVVPPTLVATSISLLVPAMGSVHNEALAVVTTVAMTLILTVLTVALISANLWIKAKSNEKAPEGQASRDLLPALIESIAEEHSLTKRESEVALHLARGYTLPQTADMLCVSLDTVRTHVKSLYKKLGIHKKQSLIAMVEEKRQAPQ